MTAAPLVGRAPERAALAGAMAAARTRPGGVVAIEGEPGIGKSRLLAELRALAEADGCAVLAGRAAEYEADLPYGVFTEALDGAIAALGERRVARLGLADAEALAAIVPALGHGAALVDRHRVHRALRDLLERLAATRPVVLCLDDVHWADPASADALAALVRRPPGGAVLLAAAARQGRLPAPVAAALGAALAEDRATALALAPLSEADAVALLGPAGAAVHALAGGNPFYLEQLARGHAGGAASGGGAATSPAGGRTTSGGAATPPAGGRATGGGAATSPAGGRPSGTGAAPAPAGDAVIPTAVAAALGAELAALSTPSRALLDAAAVAGDPFEAGLAAAVAELDEAVALGALDELLAAALVRPAGTPRRFAFRHPVVRHAVYAATPGGWRLGAHARAAAALAAQGAGPVARAHHVEHAARPGDEAAIDLLATAAAALQSPAPATAARFHAAALRLLPDRPGDHGRRARMQAQLADAQAAAGDPPAARATLTDALRTAAPEERLALTVALANQEWWLGGHEDARRRLHVALGDLPAAPSPDRIRLRLALGLTALLACDLDAARAACSDARDDARAIGDPVFAAAALASGALATVAEADGPAGAERLAASVAALDRLTPEQVATRLPAYWMHGRAHRGLGDLAASLADLERGAAVAADTGRERILLVLTTESVATLAGLGRLSAACAAGEDALERARLTGNPRMLLWALCALSAARLAAGDVAAAMTHAREAEALGAVPDFHAAGEPGRALGAALVAAGNPERALPALTAALGRDLRRVPPVERPGAAAELAEAHLALGDPAAAAAALAPGAAAAARHGTAHAAATVAVARSAIGLAEGRAGEAAGEARAAAAGVAPATAPLLHARALLALGRALGAAGDKRGAVAALAAAEAAFDSFGALRHRGEAVRELRALGHRVVRAARGDDADPLTAREREIAGLIAAGRTNREVAEQLVLSTRTVEAHLRSIYGKLGVRSRVELARDLREPQGGGAAPAEE